MQLKVNGAEQSFNGETEMPLLWYIRDVLGGGSADPARGYDAGCRPGGESRSDPRSVRRSCGFRRQRCAERRDHGHERCNQSIEFSGLSGSSNQGGALSNQYAHRRATKAQDSIEEFKKGKSMLRDKHRYALICTTTIRTALIGVPMFSPVPIVRANPGPDSAAAPATFRTKCAMCHGQDGAGSAVGKRMNVPDLRSPAVQKLPDAELAQIISNGKGGMPAFKDSL